MKQIKIRYAFIPLLCMSLGNLYAQQSANAAGGDATGSGGSASYSIGQVGIPNYLNANGNISNPGVQQPYEFFATGIEENKGISLAMTAYPNPAQSTVNLKVENTIAETLTYQLYDANGQLVLSQKISGPLTAVPMQTLSAGTYLLKVSDTRRALKSFTIIKNN